MQEVDARGLSCPEPALMAMEAMNDFPNEEIRVLVSTATQKQNVTEIARKQKREVTATQEGADFVLLIK